MSSSSGTGGAPYIVLPLAIVNSCTDRARKDFWAAVDVILGEATANLPMPWPGQRLVKVQLQDPKTGAFLKDDLADCQRGRRRLWEAKSES